MPDDARRRLLNPNIALKGVFSLAKRLGFSKQIALVMSRYLTSPRRLARAFKGYEPTSRDVFVATNLKSGTNWTMQIAYQIAHLGEGDFGHVHEVIPWPDSPRDDIIDIRDPRSWEASPTGLRVIKTHAGADVVPLSPDARYVVVIRDPKEVIVSAYHFACALFGIADTLSAEQWLDIMLVDGDGNNIWLDHTLSWWALRDEPNVLVMFYGEMKADLAGAVDKVAALMGVELNAAQRAAVIERSGLPWMKAHNHQFQPKKLPFVEPTHIPKMVRRGASGGADELYSREQLASIDALILKDLTALGSDFPYAEKFEVLSPL